ncbi:hypothetical protein QBC38DRAFT_459195 [Podospora fimiseda]|uniref:Uncharacterized protein n=1 Tax=Podospora fimiseda TaxID=252190 RepID=A0AAN7GV90_9PEZI|nr:hypothetical protein QBC38DRAFT_459195 [Podospora fimiseda]
MQAVYECFDRVPTLDSSSDGVLNPSDYFENETSSHHNGSSVYDHIDYTDNLPRFTSDHNKHSSVDSPFIPDHLSLAYIPGDLRIQVCHQAYSLAIAAVWEAFFRLQAIGFLTSFFNSVFLVFE